MEVKVILVEVTLLTASAHIFDLKVKRIGRQSLNGRERCGLLGLLADGGHHPVGDTKSALIRLSFNPQLRVEFRGATVTSDTMNDFISIESVK